MAFYNINCCVILAVRYDKPLNQIWIRLLICKTTFVCFCVFCRPLSTKHLAFQQYALVCYLLQFDVFWKIHVHSKMLVEYWFYNVEKRWIPFWKAEINIFVGNLAKYVKMYICCFKKVSKSQHFINERHNLMNSDTKREQYMVFSVIKH